MTNKYTKRYQQIVDGLVKKSFPELMGKNIHVFVINSKKYSGGAAWFPFYRVLWVTRREKFNDKQLIGLLVHELSHLEIFQKKGFFKHSFQSFLYWINGKRRRQEEINTEKLAIRKGYAREIYAMSKKLEKHKRKKSVLKYYFSPEQIKSYAQKIKKW